MRVVLAAIVSMALFNGLLCASGYAVAPQQAVYAQPVMVQQVVPVQVQRTQVYSVPVQVQVQQAQVYSVPVQVQQVYTPQAVCAQSAVGCGVSSGAVIQQTTVQRGGIFRRRNVTRSLTIVR
jgi:hypothetical protein